MELCVNYSSEVKELFEEGKLEFVDYFKLYSLNGDLSPIEWCLQHKKLVFHGLVGHGANICSKTFLEERDMNLQEDYYTRGKCPHISFHINLEASEKIETEEEIFKTIKENLEGIKKIFSYDILLENVPAREKNRTLDFLSSPEFIRKVVEKNNTYFLLDIAHAKAAAQTLGIPFMDYINALPLERVKEIHLSGCEINDAGKIVPNHSEMKEEDFILLQYLLERCKEIAVLTLEYGPYDIITHETIPTYDRVNNQLKQNVYENLLKLKKIMNK